jgi:hypothetical protein
MTGAFGAEAHIDRLRAVVGGIDDRRDHAAFGEIALLDQQAAVIAGAGDAKGVVGAPARQPRHMRAVSRAIHRGRAFFRFAVEVVGVFDAVREVGLAGVDARVDHSHLGADAVRVSPRLRQPLAIGPPLDRCSRRRAGRRLGRAQRRIVGQRDGHRAQRDVPCGKGAQRGGRGQRSRRERLRSAHFAIGEAALDGDGAHLPLRAQRACERRQTLARTRAHGDHAYLRNIWPI